MGPYGSRIPNQFALDFLQSYKQTCSISTLLFSRILLFKSSAFSIFVRKTYSIFSDFEEIYIFKSLEHCPLKICLAKS